VKFPPQNLAEALFTEQPRQTEKGKSPGPGAAPVDPFETPPLPPPESGKVDNSPVPPVRTVLSGPSWVVFSAPDDTSLPLAVGATPAGGGSAVDLWLRKMADWTIRVPRNAVRPSAPVMPGADETCLEVPFRLFLAPSSGNARWLTSSDRLPTDRPGDAREVWHAALLSREQLTPAGPLPVPGPLPPELAPPTRVAIQARAVFSPDYRRTGQPDFEQYYPGRLPLSLHALTRHRLVKQMSQGNGWVDAEHLILSSLGADASLSYTSQKSFEQIVREQLAGGGGESELAVWKHRIVVGRDVYMLEAYSGFLFPFVNPAIYVEVTQRKFAARSHGGAKHGPPGAYLLTQRYIYVRDPLRQFAGSESTLGRKMPLKKAVIRQPRSPLLERPQESYPETFNSNSEQIKKERGNRLIFLPRRLQGAGAGPQGAGNDAREARWHAEFTDESGRQSETDDAFFLFADDVVRGQRIWELLDRRYRRWSLPAQPICYAPDRPQLVVTAPPVTPAGGGPVPAGEVLTHWTFLDVERRPARLLGEARRWWLKRQGQI
jgi:hypothetical protein